MTSPGRQPRYGEVRTEAGWRAGASCRNLPADMFFPDPADDAGRKRAIRVCERCPVRAECLGEALRNNEPHGIWGGYGPIARQRLLGRVGSQRWRGYRQRQAALVDPPVPHGDVRRYVTYGCRCEPCREANVRRGRDYRARARARRTG